MAVTSGVCAHSLCKLAESVSPDRTVAPRAWLLGYVGLSPLVRDGTSEGGDPSSRTPCFTRTAWSGTAVRRYRHFDPAHFSQRRAHWRESQTFGHIESDWVSELAFRLSELRTLKHRQVYCASLRSGSVPAACPRPADAAVRRQMDKKQKASSDTVAMQTP